MEAYSELGERYRVTAEISQENADALRVIQQLIPDTLSSHVNRAVAVYAHLMDLYEDGSFVYTILGEDREIVPLFDTKEKAERAQRPLITIKANPESIEYLSKMGLKPEGAETAILDNILNCYASLVSVSLQKGQIVAECPEENERHIILY